MDALGLRRGLDNYSGFFFFSAPAKISRAGIQMGSCGLRVLSVPSSLSCLAALVGTWRARGGGWRVGMHFCPWFLGTSWGLHMKPWKCQDNVSQIRGSTQLWLWWIPNGAEALVPRSSWGSCGASWTWRPLTRADMKHGLRPRGALRAPLSLVSDRWFHGAPWAANGPSGSTEIYSGAPNLMTNTPSLCVHNWALENQIGPGQ